MKKIAALVGLIILTAQATFIGAQDTTNQLRVLTTFDLAKPAPRRPYTFRDPIAPNTPAFEQYAFPKMLSEVNAMRERWHLPIPNPLTANNTFITLIARPYGIQGAVSTKDGRFRWNFWDNRLVIFADTNYDPQSFRYHDDESARLAKMKSKIDAKQAEAIARDHLHMLGFTEKQLKLIEPPAVNQYKFEESNETIYPLPEFNVAWSEKNDPDPAPDLTFDISGITKQVVEYFNVGLNMPPSPSPTNYYDLLGVKPPTNHLQELGLRPLEPLKPGTNSASKQ